MRRRISCVRPERPRVSRGVRLSVEAGSMAYSPVTQPVPRPIIQGGTLSCTVAAHSTTVCPNLHSTEPSAKSR